MAKSKETTETADTHARAWFDEHGWQLPQDDLRAALVERGQAVDAIVELLDEAADRKRAAAAADEARAPSAPAPRSPATHSMSENRKLETDPPYVPPSAAPTNGQVAPQNLEAEESVLGAMMISPIAIGRVRDVLGDDGHDFYRDSHAIIYRAALALHDRGEPVDAITLAAELERRGELDRVGGRIRIHELSLLVPASANAPHYAGIVHEAATFRGLIRLGGETAQHGWEREGAPADIVARLLERFGELEQRTASAGDDSRLRPGGDFILDTPAVSTPVWGAGRDTAWAEGEGLVIVGPQGVGKTTVAQQLALARCGLLHNVISLPVATDPRRVLYIASDRPRQAARSLRRMVDENSRAELNDRLLIWAGPLPFRLTDQPTALSRMCERLDVGTVFLDSIKDFVRKPSDEDHANAFNMAVQDCLAAGVEVCALHHQRKEQQGGGKPKHLDDVYGNTFLTAGMGSVILLWGEPGDPIVELKHLKQPSDEVGPWEIRHNHDRGITTREDSLDAYQLLQRAGPAGITAQTVAGMVRHTAAPTKVEIEKARRQLLRLVEQGHAREEPGHGSQPARFHPTTDGRLT